MIGIDQLTKKARHNPGQKIHSKMFVIYIRD
jgi:hypothetical protein